MTGSAPNIFPALRYDDGPAAVEWLKDALGFEPRLVVPGADGTIAHAELTHGGSLVMLGSAPNPDPANPWGRERAGLYVRVDDIDAHYARARAAGARIEMEIHDTPYGSREYTLRDPGGHLWSFGTYDPLQPTEAD
ncbi:VOC family protein [Xanthobacteraceae bacterium A53D]